MFDCFCNMQAKSVSAACNEWRKSSLTAGRYASSLFWTSFIYFFKEDYLLFMFLLMYAQFVRCRCALLFGLYWSKFTSYG